MFNDDSVYIFCFSAQSKQSTPTNSGNYSDLINSFSLVEPSPVEVCTVLCLLLEPYCDVYKSMSGAWGWGGEWGYNRASDFFRW